MTVGMSEENRDIFFAAPASVLGIFKHTTPFRFLTCDAIAGLEDPAKNAGAWEEQ